METIIMGQERGTSHLQARVTDGLTTKSGQHKRLSVKRFIAYFFASVKLFIASLTFIFCRNLRFIT
jgi:hypothetical protein